MTNGHLAMTNPSRASVGTAVVTGLTLLAALVGFSLLGGGTAAEREARDAAALAQAAEDRDAARVPGTSCRRFLIATAGAEVEVVLSEIREASGFTGGLLEEEFYASFDESRVVAALTTYAPMVAELAGTRLLPQEQFDAYTRVLSSNQALENDVAVRSAADEVVASAATLQRALTNARTVCDSAV